MNIILDKAKKAFEIIPDTIFTENYTEKSIYINQKEAVYWVDHEWRK